MSTLKQAIGALRWILALCAVLTCVVVLVVGSQTNQVDFVPSPGQVTAEALMDTCVPTNGIPGGVVIQPEGETVPRYATGVLVHEALEQVFNNAPTHHVVFGFCK